VGRAAAKLIAGRGASVVVADLNEAGGAETVADIAKDGGEAIFVRADVSKDADVQGLVRSAVGRFGGLHGAFNNAAIMSAGGPLASFSLEDWHRVIAVNLTGVFLCVKHQIAYMESHGGGSIVNVASAAAVVAVEHSVDYAASKAGVLGITRVASLEYSAKGIRVNAILPGAVETPLLAKALLNPVVVATISNRHPIGRYSQPIEIAEAAAWLLSDAASFVTGSAMAVDGGYTSV
jgi:2,5-dichloro-2,5-cyclohexadiene-1,4-diol dehydrogenase 1